LLDDEPDVSRHYTELVPTALTPETFWGRYFFKLEVLLRGGGIMLGDEDEDEEEIAWDDSGDDSVAAASGEGEDAGGVTHTDEACIRQLAKYRVELASAGAEISRLLTANALLVAENQTLRATVVELGQRPVQPKALFGGKSRGKGKGKGEKEKKVSGDDDDDDDDDGDDGDDDNTADVAPSSSPGTGVGAAAAVPPDGDTGESSSPASGGNGSGEVGMDMGVVVNVRKIQSRRQPILRGSSVAHGSGSTNLPTNPPLDVPASRHDASHAAAAAAAAIVGNKEVKVETRKAEEDEDDNDLVVEEHQQGGYNTLHTLHMIAVEDGDPAGDASIIRYEDVEEDDVGCGRGGGGKQGEETACDRGGGGCGGVQAAAAVVNLAQLASLSDDDEDEGGWD
jgi:hypothetical protein